MVENHYEKMQEKNQPNFFFIPTLSRQGESAKPQTSAIKTLAPVITQPTTKLRINDRLQVGFRPMFLQLALNHPAL